MRSCCWTSFCLTDGPRWIPWVCLLRSSISRPWCGGRASFEAGLSTWPPNLVTWFWYPKIRKYLKFHVSTGITIINTSSWLNANIRSIVLYGCDIRDWWRHIASWLPPGFDLENNPSFQDTQTWGFFQWTLRFWRWVFLFLVSRWPRLWCRWGSQFTVLCNLFKHVFLDWTINTKYYHLLFAHHEQWCPSVVHDLMQTKTHGLLHGELSLLMTLHLDSRQLQGLRLTCALPQKHWKHKTPRANCHEPFASSPWPPFFQRRHNLQTAFRGRLVDGSAGWLTSSSGSSSLPQGAISLRLVGHLRSCYPVHLKRTHFIQVTTSDKSQSARAARSNICQYLCLLLISNAIQCGSITIF